jgi:hypothetical protein
MGPQIFVHEKKIPEWQCGRSAVASSLVIDPLCFDRGGTVVVFRLSKHSTADESHDLSEILA